MYYHKHAIHLLPLPETPPGDDPTHQVTDVLLYNNQTEQTKIIIEATQLRTAERNMYKLIHPIENDHYNMEEIIIPGNSFVIAKAMLVRLQIIGFGADRR